VIFTDFVVKNNNIYNIKPDSPDNYGIMMLLFILITLRQYLNKVTEENKEKCTKNSKENEKYIK